MEGKGNIGTRNNIDKFILINRTYKIQICLRVDTVDITKWIVQKATDFIKPTAGRK